MRNQKNRIFGAAVLSAAMLGCGGDDDGMTPTPDGGALESDSGAGEPDSGPGCAATIPVAPYGTLEGRKFEPITLPRCDGTPYEFYNADYCQARLTVVSIAAGWCPPCIIESGLLTEHVTEAYRDRGVRVLQILTQTETYTAPDGAYCQAWVDRFGLTNVELIDAAQLSNIYFPDGVLPSTIIVDSQGVIQYRENGVSDELRTLRARLDRLLAAMP